MEFEEWLEKKIEEFEQQVCRLDISEETYNAWQKGYDTLLEVLEKSRNR